MIAFADANTSRVTVTPAVPGTVHVVLQVRDDGRSTLTRIAAQS